MNQIDMDEIYRKMSPEEIPWNIEEPPDALVKLLENGSVRPCKTVEFGCGLGNYTCYLSGRGFDVTGVDISPTAIGIAREKARKKGIPCTFIVADILGDLKEVEGTFDFAYDWELLHHIFPEQRVKYVENVYGKLKPGGSYLSLCFSEKDMQFGGMGKYRETRLGTVLYFSSEAELRDLFEPYFLIKELNTVQVKGKYGDHIAVYVFMYRR
ncbi:MAG TPA: class I SAM-dependent methyltransferase [Nitrospirota bacterium]|nr:class I SAM-dependent methyltransferase [Nitrospirota bacterium]HUL00971.1 class I SAM-dependent methyltransferase [Nitrospirota bacterium]